MNHLRAMLEERAWITESYISYIWNRDPEINIDQLCKELRQKSGTRFTVIMPNGKVVGDSHDNPAFMENHANRPEIQQALSGTPGISIRYSPTLHETMMYIAVPIRTEDQISAVVRCSLSISDIQNSLWNIYTSLAVSGMIIAALAAVISFQVSRKISRPLEWMKSMAETIAHGELGHRLPIPANRELGGLAEAMNLMAVQLEDRIRTILQQRNEKDAILSSMIEGVLAVNREENIISINDAAAQLFQVDREKVIGRSIQEAIRNPELHRFVERTMSSRLPVEGDIVVRDSENHYLQVHGASLLDAEGERIGVVVVLNDVTHLRKLENLRREFVANVSHELKTPITSIKGYVETLLDGAIDSPEDSVRFLQIIVKHTDRLNSIIEDLLSLSRIEQDSERSLVELQDTPLHTIIHSVVEYVGAKAKEKNITIESDCPEQVHAAVNPPLLEQALSNLIDNAIKYSEPDSRVWVTCRHTDGEVTVQVLDQGCGIEPRHLSRLFERFYRVDKARSRTLGGTGLGLAIVKHIAQAHGGQVTVKSTPGKGSIFTIHLPGSCEDGYHLLT